jgi:hypothetical protein
VTEQLPVCGKRQGQGTRRTDDLAGVTKGLSQEWYDVSSVVTSSSSTARARHVTVYT